MKATPEAKPRRRRWLRWLVVVFLGLGISAAGLGWWAWKERVTVVNVVLDRILPGVNVHMDELHLENDVVRLKGVTARWRENGTKLASADEVLWKPRWRELAKGALGSIQLDGAEVDLDLDQLRALSGGDKTGVSRVWRLDEIEFAEMPVTLRDKNGVLLSLTVAQRMEGLEIGGATPKFKLLDVHARDVVWRDHPVVASAKMTAKTTAAGLEVLSLTAGNGNVDTSWLPKREAAAESPASTWPRHVVVHDVTLENMRVSLADVQGLKGGFRFSWKGRELVWEQSAALKLGAHELQVTELLLRPLAGGGEIRATALSVEAEGLERIRAGNLKDPRLVWSQALEDALLSKGDSGPKSSPRLMIDQWAIDGGEVLVTPTKLVPLTAGLKWHAVLRGLVLNDSGLHSAEKQRVEVSEVQLAWKELEPFLTLKAARVEVVPDVAQKSYRIDEVMIDEPRIVLKPGNGPWFDKIAEPGEQLMQPVPLPKRFGFGQLTIKDATVRASVPLNGLMDVEAAFQVTPTADGASRLSISQTRARAPLRPNAPVASVQSLEVVARVPELWRTHRFESVTLNGGQVDVGEALVSLFATKAATTAELKAKAVAERWTARQVDVRAVSVTLEEIAPKFPPLNFSVNFTAKETPLDLEGLAENVEPQEIVLRSLSIPSPHRPLNPVAELDEIRVHYTLDGLLRRRIDRVNIVKPTVFLGEDLFWYVESYRELMDREQDLVDSLVGPVQPPAPKAPAWAVDTLAVTEGRLVVAPKGVPLKGMGEPFPFSFETKLESGEMHAELAIPNEDREFANLKLRFTGLRGRVVFDLPMKDRKNQVVEVFEADRMQWKNLHAEKTSLSVTYDRNGIYGTFYAKAYMGDINGAFDFYLDEAYTWDGWLAVTKIQSGPVTQALFPEYLMIDGIVSGKVVATGDAKELYQADLEFLNNGGGRFKIAALNEMIDDLPKPKRGDLSEQIQRIGLETLRDFDYDSVDGQGRFYGREGRGHLRFAGPSGKRTMEVRVFDHRWKGDVVDKNDD
jgi:hypothetical protein